MIDFTPRSIIFLDLDGVVNTHDFDRVAMSNPIHRDKIQRVNRILVATRGVVVLSSAWRYIIHRGEANLSGFDWLLRSHGFMQGRLLGITRADTMMPKSFDGTPGSWPIEDERGQQITDWIVGEGWKHYGETGRHVVIDDGGIRPDGSWTDLGIVAAGHPFVRTQSDVGLMEEDADKAINILTEGKS